MDTEAKRISLSIREVLEDEAMEAVNPDEFDIPETVEETVEEVTGEDSQAAEAVEEAVEEAAEEAAQRRSALYSEH